LPARSSAPGTVRRSRGSAATSAARRLRWRSSSGGSRRSRGRTERPCRSSGTRAAGCSRGCWRCGGPPHRDERAVHPALWLGACALAATGAVRYRCGAGGCCDAFNRDLAAPVPPGIDFVSIYSRLDGVVDWQACLDPAARMVEVDVPHLALTKAAPAVAAVDAALRPLPERVCAPAVAERVRRPGRPARARARLAGATS
jgi:hypothetical protein